MMMVFFGGTVIGMGPCIVEVGECFISKKHDGSDGTDDHEQEHHGSHLGMVTFKFSAY